jgi:hypothetical protein
MVAQIIYPDNVGKGLIQIFYAGVLVALLRFFLIIPLLVKSVFVRVFSFLQGFKFDDIC